MRRDLSAAFARHSGVADFAQLSVTVPPRSLSRAIRRGEAARLLPRTFVVGADVAADDRLRAAVHCSGGALSHSSALAVWGLEVALDDSVHVTIPASRRVRSRVGMTVHRARMMPSVVERNSLPVIQLERSLVDAWDILPSGERRAPIITAVRRRLTTPDRVRAALDARPQVRGARECRTLVNLLADGCQSELEIWGCQRVLHIPGLPPPELQVHVAAGGRGAYLDAGWADVLLGVELDGAASHGSRSQREADIRRDSWLSGLGWLVLRFSYRRLTTDTPRVRREIAAAYLTRRQQLRS